MVETGVGNGVGTGSCIAVEADGFGLIFWAGTVTEVGLKVWFGIDVEVEGIVWAGVEIVV